MCIRDRIRSRKPDGYTAMYDALGQYVTGTDDVDGRKVLVIFTDGGDPRGVLGLTDVLTQLRAQYTVGYVSTNSSQDGRWRKVEIKVRRPDLKGSKIQTRKGYFGPYKPSR